LVRNRLTTYLFYAVGEIILVVIGILLALQINEWNDSRKARKTEIKFYKNILTDLEKDEEKLYFYQEFLIKRIECLDTLLRYVRNPQLTMGIDKFGLYVEPIYYSFNATTYNTAFESAKSMGTFSRFKDEHLLKKLSEYYAGFNSMEDVVESITRFVEKHFEPIMYTLPEGYMKPSTGDLVIIEDADQFNFYEKVASIPDNRNIDYDYQKILNMNGFENYLIGDMGRSYNALGKVNYRLERLAEIKAEIIAETANSSDRSL